MTTALRRIADGVVADTTQQTLRTMTAAERATVSSYEFINYHTAPVDITIWWGSATDGKAMRKNFTLDAAPSSGKSGGTIRNDPGEIHVIEASAPIIVQVSVANVISYQLDGPLESPLEQ